MSNRISFNKLLTQKRSLPQNGVGENSSTDLSLAQYVEEFINYPNQQFYLKFGEGESQGSMENSQKFESGVNALDSWVMSQTQFKSKSASAKREIFPSKNTIPT